MALRKFLKSIHFTSLHSLSCPPCLFGQFVSTSTSTIVWKSIRFSRFLFNESLIAWVLITLERVWLGSSSPCALFTWFKCFVRIALQFLFSAANAVFSWRNTSFSQTTWTERWNLQCSSTSFISCAWKGESSCYSYYGYILSSDRFQMRSPVRLIMLWPITFLFSPRKL